MRKSSSGFTIVELLIVIVVIAILATISVVVYSGIQQRARESVLKSALSNAGKWMQTQNAENGNYPTSLSGLKGQEGIALSLSTVTSGFCINGETLSGSPLAFRYESAGGIQEGLCSGAVISGSESGISPNLVTNTDFSSGWSLVISNSTGRSLNTRAGTLADPYPSRPVLILTNSATTSVSYAVITSSGVNYAEVEDGKTYNLSFYVRKVGPFSGGSIRIGIGNSSNSTITIDSFTGSSITPSDTWQKLTRQGTAARKETGDQRIYVPLSTPPLTTSGWQLEFQGFEIRES